MKRPAKRPLTAAQRRELVQSMHRVLEVLDSGAMDADKPAAGRWARDLRSQLAALDVA